MKLYKLSQTVNNGYDTYDSVVVAAKNAKDAKTIHPSLYVEDPLWWKSILPDDSTSWVWSLEHIKVKYLGVAAKGIKRGLILSSFNAG